MSPDDGAAHAAGSRQQWTDAATDYVLEHGLIGLSLRPLAAALGTSDRMLIYRFGNKDSLVAEVLDVHRQGEGVRRAPAWVPGPRCGRS